MSGDEADVETTRSLTGSKGVIMGGPHHGSRRGGHFETRGLAASLSLAFCLGSAKVGKLYCGRPPSGDGRIGWRCHNRR